MRSFTSEIVDADLLVRVGSGSKVHVFRTHPRLKPVTDRLSDGETVRAVALCGSKGEMSLVEDDQSADVDADACGTCARMIGDTERGQESVGRAAAG